MNYKLTDGDKNVVANIRYTLKEKVDKFTNEQIAEQWKQFSQSEEYYAANKDNEFLKWLNNSYD